MIKLATMTSVCPDWSLDEVIDGMKKYGYQGLEPRVGWGHASGIELDMSADKRKAVRKRFEQEGLEICCVATGARFAATESADLEKSLTEARAAIDLASDLGAPLIRTFGGARGGG
ncbi:MAG: TIM barrel protein [bacterium]|nr:TIM barrel protein [bacterium]